jgi:multiphosphoryl transfer protein
MQTAPLTRSQIIIGSTVNDKQEAIAMVAGLMASSGLTAPEYLKSLEKRENVSNTFLGHGVAIPHGMIEDRHLIHRTGIVVVQVPHGLEWNPGEQVHLVVGIAARSDDHLAILRKLTRLMQDGALMQRLFSSDDADVLLRALDDAAEAPLAAPTATNDGDAQDFAHAAPWILDYPNGLHARPASVWVQTARQFKASLRVRRGPDCADARKLVGLLQLGLENGDALTVSAEGEDAEAALAALLAAMQGLVAAEHAAADAARARAAEADAVVAFVPASAGTALQGIAASPGLSIGTTYRLARQQAEIEDIPAPLAVGGSQLETALERTRTALNALASDTALRLGEDAAVIFHAQATLLSDADLVGVCCKLMAEGHGVAWSWHQAVEAQAEKLAALDNALLAARAADLRDVGRRVLGELIPDSAGSAMPDQQQNIILLADDLAPSDTATLDTRRILGLCTARGGPTAHTAIIARTLGLPALVGAGDALLQIADGTPAILDGQTGKLYLNPSDADLEAARAWIGKLAEARDAQRRAAGEPAVTLDGRRVEIAANINRADQAAGAWSAGAEGVGLMRTEFLFLERGSAPDEDEQYAAYRAMVEACAGRPLIVRTLDIGGDKQAPWLGLPEEDNPFLGVRGARLLLRRRDLLQAQMRALYRAAAHGPLSVMFPMVTSVAELQALRAACEEIRLELNAPVVELGIMIEVPAAAALADRLARHADFFSIGTNDLTQYVLAMDRQHPELAAEADALHPAVLRLIRQTVLGARAAGIKTGVCGGLAGDPAGAAMLCGLGVDELSMSPGDVPAVKARLRASRHDTLEALALKALDCDGAAEVRALAGGAA